MDDPSFIYGIGMVMGLLIGLILGYLLGITSRRKFKNGE